VTSIFFITPFIMDFSQLSEENHDIELSKVFAQKGEARKRVSSDNLKSMLCIHSDISNKPASIVDDMSTSTSHALILN
jgi:hypothetical protein